MYGTKTRVYKKIIYIYLTHSVKLTGLCSVELLGYGVQPVTNFT